MTAEVSKIKKSNQFIITFKCVTFKTWQVPLRLWEQETMQYFLNAFYTRTGFSQDLFPDIELLKV